MLKETDEKTNGETNTETQQKQLETKEINDDDNDAEFDDAEIDDAEIDREILADLAKKRQQAFAKSGTKLAAVELREKYLEAKSLSKHGWLVNMLKYFMGKPHIEECLKQFKARKRRIGPVLIKQTIDAVRVGLQPILIQQPPFVITDMGQFDVALWAVNLTPKPTTYKTFIAPSAQMKVTKMERKTKNSKAKKTSTVRPITQQEKDAAWAVAKWMNNDWLIAPLVGWLIRLIEPETICAEVPTPPPPIIQFVDSKTQEQHHKNYFHHMKMLTLRIPLTSYTFQDQIETTKLENAENRYLCVDMLTGGYGFPTNSKDDIIHSIDLSLFLMMEKAGQVPEGQKAFSDLFKLCIDIFVKLVYQTCEIEQDCSADSTSSADSSTDSSTDSTSSIDSTSSADSASIS